MDVNCPYCNAEQDIDHDDGYGYGEDTYSQQCSACNMIFTYTTAIIYSYDAKKSICLNGGEHQYRKSWTYPSRFSVMVCQDCGESRELTPEEKLKYVKNDE